MRRGLIATFVVVAALAGCLFPSFDGLKGKDTGDDDDDSQPGKDGGSSSSSSSASSSGSTSSTSSSSGAPADSGKDTGTTTPAKVRCKDLQCDVATTFCCVGNDSTTVSCRAKSAGTDGCLKVIECDGTQDCAPGQTCCGTPTAESECKTSCGVIEVVMCQKEAPLCPEGTCKPSNISSAPGFTLDICD